MQDFHEVKEAEEFDWFLEKTQEQETTDYDSIIDLKQEALRQGVLEREVQEAIQNKQWQNGFACGDIEEDGRMWKYSEGLAAAMRDVFCAVSEKLCGYGIQNIPESISGYMEQLGRKCEVVQSGIYREDVRNADGQEWYPEQAARIEACLSENGCVIAMVADEQWRYLRGEEELPFADSGVRSLQVVGMKGNDIIVNDFADENGCCLHVPLQQFCALHGILAEVYK